MTEGSRRGRVTVYAPGSVSNLGPGFDCLGAAVFGCGDHVTARPLRGPRVRVDVVSDARIPRDPERNTAALAAAAVLRRAGIHDGVSLEVRKGLPLAGGLGGSAASAVAGALAADLVYGCALPREELLAAALDAEAVVSGRHPDNVAPSLLGGAVLVLSVDPLRVARVPVHASLRLVLATPSYAVETAAARAVLPASVPRAVAVSQAARLGGLLLGLERGDRDLVRASLTDAIAEPARAALHPGYAEARVAAEAAGALGVVVSGSGPTVVALAPEGTTAAVEDALRLAYGRRGFDAVLRTTEVDALGAREVDA